MIDWKEKYGAWALVTGASSGIGSDFVRQLAEKGLNIVLVARREHRLRAVADEVSAASNVECLVVQQDLTEPGAAKKVAEAVGDRDIGMLVNNAGFGMLGCSENLEPGRLSEMVLLNCLAPLELTNIFLPRMVGRGRGALLFLASTAAYQSTGFFSLYGATKSFNLFYGEALWAEYAGKGIDVLALSPGPTKTEFQAVANPGHPIETPFPLASSPDVVSLALRKLGKTPSVVHGKLNSLMIFLERFLPRKWVAVAAARIMSSRM